MRHEPSIGAIGSRLLVITISALAVASSVIFLAASPLWAAESTNEELAKAAQNPVANLVSVPFQENINFNVGPQGGVQSILNIQPVIPFELSADWNLITRTIMPVVSQPPFAPGQDTQFGLGDAQLSLFLSPAKKTEGFIWGVGMITQTPTHTDSRLGSPIWGLGPSIVGLRIDGPWVYGALINNVWSLGGSGSNAYNNFLLQPFINYNFGKTGTYLTSSPIATANWKTGQWVVPLGGGIGQIFRMFGKLPVNAQLSSYYNVAHPEDLGPEWQIRFQVQFLFPK